MVCIGSLRAFVMDVGCKCFLFDGDGRYGKREERRREGWRLDESKEREREREEEEGIPHSLA